MNGTVTIDDVWAVLRENALQQKESDRQMQEIKANLNRLAEQTKESLDKLAGQSRESLDR
ncbi:MAG: hypothetical protein HQL60_08960, partial [Magnetococcales bacterium]|nr:hypothetical protein [Magnetococcales bacterium]